MCCVMYVNEMLKEREVMRGLDLVEKSLCATPTLLYCTKLGRVYVWEIFNSFPFSCFGFDERIMIPICTNRSCC